jgi:hypothetical protein
MRLFRDISAFVLLTTVISVSRPAFAVNEAVATVDNFKLPITDSLPAVPTGETDWSLPITGKLGDEEEKQIRKLPRRFDASITASDAQNAVANRVDQLLDSALEHDPQTKILNKAVSHYRTKTQVVVAETKDTLDYLIPYRGFGPSSEAGDIILDEQMKLKSRASAEYAKQRHIDDTHIKVVSNMMQLAMGMGNPDTKKGSDSVAEGYASLKELVGAEEADRTLSMLKSWTLELEVPASVYAQGAWDVKERQDKLKTVLSTALEQDAVLHEITKRVHKYNHKSKFARASAHIVETVLGAAALTPTFVGPAAKTALVTFVMATGGPESCKLLKELYLDKRFESRWKVLNEEAHMALENYHIAMLTHNPVLLACSESLIDQMAGEETVKTVFGTAVLPKQAVASKESTNL